jgi:hypothetical protein
MAGAAGIVVHRAVTGGGEGLTVAPADLSLDDVEPALLTAGDVGDGFASYPVKPSDAGPLRTSVECRDAYDRIDPSAPNDAGRQTGLWRASDETSVWHELTLIETGAPSLDELHETLERCGAITAETGDDGDEPYEMEVRTEPVDGPGEDALAVDVRFDFVVGGAHVTFDAYGYAFARGGVLSTVLTLGSMDPDVAPTTELDPDAVRHLAELTDQRLEKLLAS